MSTTSGGAAAPTRRILVWDIPTRFFHAALATCFAGAWLLSESERWRHLHFGFGYAVLALVAFRIVWGLVGSRYARFSDFAFRPRAAFEYAKSLLGGRPRHYVGHNPLGGLAIVAILLLAVATGATGWAMSNDIGGEALEELHEMLAATWLTVVGLHVAGVVVGSLLHRENLARAMVTGHKTGDAVDAIPRTFAPAGVVLAALVAFAFAWGAGWTGLATGPGAAALVATETE